MTNKEKQNIRNIAQILIEPVIAVNDIQRAGIASLVEDVTTVQETLADQLLALANTDDRPVLADASGNLKLGTYWIDYTMPLTTGKVGANSKPDFDYTNIGYLFPQNDTSEALYMVVQLPHGYKVGSNINPHVHYKRTEETTPTFKIDYAWFNIGDEQPAYTTLTMNQHPIAYTSGSRHAIAEATDMLVGDSKGISSLLLVKLYRDDNAVTGDVLAWQFDCHIECDTLGSSEEYIK